MLAAELRGAAYSKATHRRNLLPLLRNRSEGAIERKHGNISAILIELGFPYIPGYKPFRNYQQLLFEVVASRLQESRRIADLVAADVDAEASVPTVDDILGVLVDPPPTGEAQRIGERSSAPYGAPLGRARVDYLQREAANASLGSAGERFVVAFERARLLAAGHDRLANRVEHVSETQGDGCGFDILSYEQSGRERLIEVKTTRYGARTPFFVSTNEVRVSEWNAEQYRLYRVYGFRRDPKLFAVSGALSTRFSLDPTEFVARIP